MFRFIAPATLVVLGLTTTVASAGEPTRLTVVGSLMERHSAWEGGLIVTRTRLHVDQAMRGSPPASVIEVTELGGQVGDIAQVVLGQPMLPRRQPSVAVELAAVGNTWRVAALLEQVSSVDPGAPVAAAAHAYVRTTTKDSEPPCDGDSKDVYWPTADVHYVLDAACSSDTDVPACEAAVKASFQTWEDVDCSYLSFTYDGRRENAPVGYDRKGPNLNVVKWLEYDWPAGPGAAAVTLATIGCDSGKQLDADILVNGTTPIYSATPQPGVDLTDIQNTLTHEVGHLAGFAHSPDPESTMFATGDSEEIKKRDLTADDIQGLCDVYPLGHEPLPEPGEGCSCATSAGRTPAGGEVVVTAGALVFALSRRRYFGCGTIRR